MRAAFDDSILDLDPARTSARIAVGIRRTTVEVLQVDLGANSGFLSDRRLTVEHDTFQNFGWGLGYNGFTLDAEVEGEGRLSSKVNMEYQGLLLYLRWYF